MLAAGGGTASPLAGAEAEAIGSELRCVVDPGVRRHRHVKVRMCDFLFIFLTRKHKILQTKYKT